MATQTPVKERQISITLCAVETAYGQSDYVDALKRMRSKDDKIVYELNRIVPTQSFAKNTDTTNQCKSLYEQLMQNYSERENAIKRCIGYVSNEVVQLREKKQKNMDNEGLLKQLRNTQRTLRLMQKELQVDEVVRDRSLKVFYEKCRTAYTPPNRPEL